MVELFFSLNLHVHVLFICITSKQIWGYACLLAIICVTWTRGWMLDMGMCSCHICVWHDMFNFSKFFHIFGGSNLYIMSNKCIEHGYFKKNEELEQYRVLLVRRSDVVKISWFFWKIERNRFLKEKAIFFFLQV